MATLLITSCGCVALVGVDQLIIIDGNRLPETDIQIGWIRFNDTTTQINTTFIDTNDLLQYFNSTFVEEKGLLGVFSWENGLIYSNPEGFTTAEIMAILKPTTLIFSMGSPYIFPNEEYTPIPVNASFIQDDRINGKITAIRVGGANLEPINEDGYTQSVGLDRIDFNGPNLSVNDSNIYIEFIQTT